MEINDWRRRSLIRGWVQSLLGPYRAFYCSVAPGLIWQNNKEACLLHFLFTLL